MLAFCVKMLDYIYSVWYYVITKGKGKDSPHRLPALGESHPSRGKSIIPLAPLKNKEEEKMNTYAINNELNGIEVYFSQKPEQNIIEELKAKKWRWNRAKKCWYAKQSESSLTLAKEIASVEIEPQATKAKAKATTYHKNVSDYITIEEYEKSLREYYNPERYDRNTPEEREQFITHNMETTYNSDNEYRNISKYIGSTSYN